MTVSIQETQETLVPSYDRHANKRCTQCNHTTMYQRSKIGIRFEHVYHRCTRCDYIDVSKWEL